MNVKITLDYLKHRATSIGLKISSERDVYADVTTYNLHDLSFEEVKIALDSIQEARLEQREKDEKIDENKLKGK